MGKFLKEYSELKCNDESRDLEDFKQNFFAEDENKTKLRVEHIKTISAGGSCACC